MCVITTSSGHAWKHRYSACCLSITTQQVFNTKLPSYEATLEVDRTIRKFPIPKHLSDAFKDLDGGGLWDQDYRHALQQYTALWIRESNLLFLHRSYFAQAIRKAPADPLSHKYAPSVLAVFRSTIRLLGSLRGFYSAHNMVGKVWIFWSVFFSSCVSIHSCMG
jgi:hypothetical protein